MEKEKWKAAYVAENAIWAFGFFYVIIVTFREGTNFWMAGAMGALLGVCVMVSAMVAPERKVLPKGVKAYFAKRLPLVLCGSALGSIVAVGLMHFVHSIALNELIQPSVMTWAVAGRLFVVGAIVIFLIIFFPYLREPRQKRA